MNSARTRSRSQIIALSLVVAGTLGLGACSSDNAKTQETATEQTQSQSQTEAPTEQAVVLTDGYVRAKTADSPMTAVFGTLTNNTDKDIHVVKASGDLPGMYQFHEVTGGVMKETEDGIVIPANGTLLMEPGSHHIMIMDNHDEIAAGDVLSLTLTDDAGNDYELTDIPVRVQQSGNENYGADTSAEQNDAEHAGH